MTTPVTEAETLNVEPRIALAIESLMGLSVGDAFGQQYFTRDAAQAIASQSHAPPPWNFTDDTIMASAIVEQLKTLGRIEQDSLAAEFARRYTEQPDRGYGATAARILREISQGMPWREAAGEVFEKQGSMGNGAAMRAGPIGAYFANDVSALIQNARTSAEVTHAHEDGQAGAVAVAAATGFAARSRGNNTCITPNTMFEFVIDAMPVGPTREGIIRAASLDLAYDVNTAVQALGNGSRLLSCDTVPLALWCVARHPDSFESALWTTVTALGDRDTTCAIVGSILAVALGSNAIPRAWLNAREPLAFDSLGNGSAGST